MTTLAPTRLITTSLPYRDANSVPWPINHHAYIEAVADELVSAGLLEDAPIITLPVVHSQSRDVRTAALSITEDDVYLIWDELDGWTRHGVQVIPEAGPLLEPDVLAAALADPKRLPPHVRRGRRLLAHPTDHRIESALAAYRYGPALL